VLALGVAVGLGRWPAHWSDHLGLALVSGLVVVGLAVGAWTARTAGPFRLIAAVCLVDAAIVVRAWSVHLPLHCSCVRSAGSPALAGWGGAVIVADVVLCALAVWLGRTVDRTASRS
jgi:hypothetical protein